MENYRSILKVIEKFMLTCLVNYLKENDIMTPGAFVFEASISTAPRQLTEHVIDKLEERAYITGMFLESETNSTV